MTVHCFVKPLNTELGAVFVSKHARFHLTTGVATEFPRSQSSRLWSLGSAPEMTLPHQDTRRRVDHLKRWLVEEWRQFSQDTINRAVRHWRVKPRPHQQQCPSIVAVFGNHVERNFVLSNQIEHVQFVSTLSKGRNFTITRSTLLAFVATKSNVASTLLWVWTWL